MAFLENQGAKIYWDEQSKGDPILLIMGLGYPSYLWHRMRPVLNERYRTIALDNRGSGQSDTPAGPYPIALMASDAAAALDAAGVESAHVFGLSMGGMIAQEFALQYPARVRSLILGCTAPGGPNAVRAEKQVTEVLMARNMSPEEAARAMHGLLFMMRQRRSIAWKKIWRFVANGSPSRKDTWRRCRESLPGSYSRIGRRIAICTLVIHGLLDQLDA